MQAPREFLTSWKISCKLSLVSRTGIGPETFAFASSDGGFTNGAAPTSDQQDFYEKHGFYITDSDYILRPEVMESNFYAWRSTGDIKYLNRASQVTQSINKYLSVNNAYAGIEDVDSATSKKIDDMESFWFAETLKYLYVAWFLTSKCVLTQRNVDIWLLMTPPI